MRTVQEGGKRTFRKMLRTTPIVLETVILRGVSTDALLAKRMWTPSKAEVNLVKEFRAALSTHLAQF